MTPQAALIELLARVGARNGAAVFISAEELSEWPAAAVAAMKSKKLLAKARPAVSVVCPGTAGRESAERVGNPRWQARYIVEGEHMAVAGGDEQVAVLARQRPQGRGVGIEQRP
jgi:hypothetical protein